MGVVASRSARALTLVHYDMGLWGPATDPPDPRLPRILLALGTMAASQQRDDLAQNFFRRALRAAEALRPPDPTQTRNALVDLGLFYQRRGRSTNALPFLEGAVDISAGLPEPALHAIDLDNLALALDQLKRHSEANALSRKALAGSHVDQGRYGEAEPLYRERCCVEPAEPRRPRPWSAARRA